MVIPPKSPSHQRQPLSSHSALCNSHNICALHSVPHVAAFQAFVLNFEVCSLEVFHCLIPCFHCACTDVTRPLRNTPQQSTLRGAWSDRDTNDIFAHCSLIFYFLDLKFSNFVCPSELHPLIWFFLKIPSGKRKISEKPPKTP